MIDIKRLPERKSLDIEFIRSGMTPESLMPHRHAYFEIFWACGGTGSHTIDFVEYPLRPGRLYCIAPGQVHDCQDLPDELIAISFTGDFLSGDHRGLKAIEALFPPDHLHPPHLELDETGDQELRLMIDILHREMVRQSPDNDLMSILLTGFLRYLMRDLPSAEDKPNQADERIARLSALIDTHFTTHRDAGFYAGKLALTTKRVNELTRRHLSKTITRLVHDRIILEARRSLAFTDETVKAIGLNLGYEDTAYFCRFFRKQTGESPITFRKRWQGHHQKKAGGSLIS